MHKDPETDLVVVDADKCIGCGHCAMACPYGVPTVDRKAGHSVKCDGCIDRVKAGKKPICVEACPLRALYFDEIGSLRKSVSGVQQIHPMPDASITKPHIIIKPSPAAASPLAVKGFIANPKEVQ
jgi:anaerobic dimethyl sulfoxide reductase subunit B (iron-sulfur subunit)